MVHEGTQLSGLQKVPKVPKRDLVDTCYHASRVTRYGATLGLGFPTLCERGGLAGKQWASFHFLFLGKGRPTSWACFSCIPLGRGGKGKAYILGLLFFPFSPPL